jgi:hypothetical protein
MVRLRRSIRTCRFTGYRLECMGEIGDPSGVLVEGICQRESIQSPARVRGRL